MRRRFQGQPDPELRIDLPQTLRSWKTQDLRVDEYLADPNSCNERPAVQPKQSENEIESKFGALWHARLF
jgi:hypothetical protein